MKKIKLSEYRVYRGFLLFFAGWGFWDFITKLGSWLRGF